MERDLASDHVTACLEALTALDGWPERTPLSEELCQGLLQCLGHAKKTIQRQAAEYLVRFARIQPEIISLLREKLSDPDLRLRWTAAFTLAQMDLSTSLSLSVLLENLGHEESDLRWAAATAVITLGQKHSQIKPDLVQLARQGNPTQRRMSLYCLRDLGWEDPAVIEVFLAATWDEAAGVRLAALSGMGKLKQQNADLSQSAIRHAIRLLQQDPEIGVRRAAAVALGQRGEFSSETRAALEEAAQGADTSLRKAAEAALKRLRF
jgi:HEAT repeat protein